MTSPSTHPLRPLLAGQLELLADNLAMVAAACQKQYDGKLILERMAANFLGAQTEPGDLLRAGQPAATHLRRCGQTLRRRLVAHQPDSTRCLRRNSTQTFHLPTVRQSARQRLRQSHPHPARPHGLPRLGAGCGKETRFPPALRKAMQNAKCFLFLGFDYENWYLRVFLHVLKFSEKAELVLGLPENHRENGLSAAIATFFSARFKFSFFEENALDLLGKLHEKFSSGYNYYSLDAAGH